MLFLCIPCNSIDNIASVRYIVTASLRGTGAPIVPPRSVPSARVQRYVMYVLCVLCVCCVTTVVCVVGIVYTIGTV